MAGLVSHLRESCTLAVLLANQHRAMSINRDMNSNETTDVSSEYEDEINEPYDLSLPKIDHDANEHKQPENKSDYHRLNPDRTGNFKQNGFRSSPNTNGVDAESKQSTCISGMLQGMNDMRRKRILCDVIFCLDDGEEFFAHKAVMASCSEFCREIFFTDHRLSQENVTTIHLDLPSKGLSLLLDYVYTGNLVLDDRTVGDVQLAATKLRISKLLQACEEHIKSREELKSSSPLSDCSQYSDACDRVASPDASSRDLCSKGQENSPEFADRDAPPSRARCSSDSTTFEKHAKRELPAFERADKKALDELARPLQHSKSEGESSHLEQQNVRDNKVGRGCGSAAGLLNAATSSGGLYQPVHWKKHQLIGRASERSRPTSKGQTSLFSSASDEVFLNPSAAPIPTNAAQPSTPTLPSGSGNESSTNNFFTYNFNTRQSQVRNMFSMPGYPEFGGMNSFPSLLAYQLGGSSPLENPFSYFRNRVQSHDLNAVRFGREFYPLFSPPRDGEINPRHGTSMHYNSVEPLTPLKTNFGGHFASSYGSVKSDTTGPISLRSDKRRRKANSAEYYFSPTNSRNDSVRKFSSPTERKSSPIIVSDDSNSESRHHEQTGKQFKKGDAGKPYKCPLCDASFNRPANLKTHMRIHSGEKPYKCDTCGARFVQVAHLRAHVLIHTGEKPYPCNVCGTRFRHLQTLKSHLRIHTGEKPYSCEKCSVQFRHKSQLRLHLRTKHGIQTNTKKTYKQVPGLCSADICAHIKRAQEAVKTQHKVDETLDQTDKTTISADAPHLNDDFGGVSPRDEKCSSDDMMPTAKTLTTQPLFKISMHGRLAPVPERRHLDVPSLNISHGAGMDLKVV